MILPEIAETTCLGAAYAAELAVGSWPNLDSLRANWAGKEQWTPAIEPERREREYHLRKKAVQRTLNWVEDEPGS